MYNKVFDVSFCFVVYYVYFVEKMDNFLFGLVKFVGSHRNLLSLIMVVENFVFVKVSEFVYLYERVELFAVHLHSYNYVKIFSESFLFLCSFGR